MKDLSKESVFNLANRLNQIELERQKLDMEHNRIVRELWERIPSLKNEEDIQLKVLKKKL